MHLAMMAGFFLASGGGAKAANVIQATSYGVKCDNTSDDTSSLQAFFNALTANTSGSIQPGRCLFSSTLSLPNSFTSIRGSGQYSTTLVYNGASTNIDLVSIASSSASAVPGNMSVSDLGVSSTTTMTGGSGIHLKNVGFMVLQNITVDGQAGTGKLFDGIWFQNTDFIRFEGFDIRAQDDGLRVSAGGVGGGAQFDFFGKNGKIGGSKIGVHVGGGFDNFHLDYTELTTNSTNVVVDHSLSAYKNQEVIFGPNVVTDYATSGDNYYISDNLADRNNYCNIVIAGPITHSAQGNGIHVKDWPNCFITVQSPYIQNNNQSGVQVDDASAIVNISPSTLLYGNGQYGLSETFPTTSLINTGAAIGNTAGQYNANVAGSVNFPVQLSSGANVQLNVGSGISSAGSTSSNATQLTKQYNYVTTATSGQGVRLPAFVNTEMLVQNASGQNNLVVYPPAGARYGAAAANSGISLNSAGNLRVLCTSTTQCWVD